MNSSTMNLMTAKWLTILRDYEKIKAGNCSIFKTINQLCEAHHVHRKDIRKYYERWIKTDKDRSALLPQKRGPRLGKYKRLSKEEERIILKIHRRLGASPTESVWRANEFEIFEMLKPRFTAHP